MRMNFRKIIVPVFCLSIALCACQSKEETGNSQSSDKSSTSTETKKEVVKEKFIAWSLGTENNDIEMAEAYNAQSTKYILEYDDALAGLDGMTEGIHKLRLAYESGTGPDLATANSGEHMKALIESISLQDLTRVFKEHGWDKLIPEYLVNDNIFDGKLYGLPTCIETVGIYYNKSIFAELDLNVPTTWNEYIALMDKIKNAGYYPYALGLSGGWPAAFQASQYGYISGGSEYLAAMKGEIPWEESEACLKALQMYEIIGKKYSNPDVVAIDQTQAQELFFSGKTAMTLNTSSYISNVFQAAPDFEVGFFYVPPINPDSDILIFGGTGGNYIVSANGNTEAVYDYIDWAYGDDGASATLNIGKTIPPIMEYELTPEVDPLFKEIATATKEKIEKKIGTWPAVYMPGYLFGNYNQFIQGMMGGILSPEDVIKKLQEDRQKYDAENK